MALTASCDALYFPSDPRDNVLTVRWSAQDAPLLPNTSVIFKIKCTAPHLFHAQPRYGALLLADTAGASMPSSNQMTTITFSLRGNHGDGDGGISPSGGSRQTASRASSATPGGPAYQERFAIEYVLIKSEPLAFQQILSSLADAARMTEVVKNMWSLIASGAIPRTHLGVQGGINLKVYMENVVLQSSDPAPNGGDEATKVIVPPEARLVVPIESERHSGSVADATNSRRTQATVSPSPRLYSGGDVAHHQGSTSLVARRKPSDELRALREEINTMRREPVTQSSAAGGTVRNSLSPSANTPNSQARGNQGSAAVEAFSAPRVAGASSSDNLIMKFNLGGVVGRVDAPAAAQRGGLKVYMVLTLMFALYISLLFMRRGATRAVESGKHGCGTGTHEAANSCALQVSSP
ncbi:hypothetical protein LPMP_050540 [Leishmania panamensis]|uniref:Uncharacterized protein n=3 Tax=Leishmania guyanensis species complex TaxID=38579 RepID=A0A088S1Y5_LEIPA|nr:hypothetical protein LPMP_050540 [Leishmania panamensis]AIN95496.1 hypothetical protein LPMP_050540 [Leishmania panamensis]CCM12863.1 hypothetical protein, conserved [Leishmania guyanensis]